MKAVTIPIVLMISLMALANTGMGRHGAQYDEEARQEQKTDRPERKVKNPARGIASGVKDVAFDSPAGFVSETAETAREEGAVVGTLEGARKGSGVVLDQTVKGAFKVATFGQAGDTPYEVKDPEANSGETTTVTIKLPGT